MCTQAEIEPPGSGQSLQLLAVPPLYKHTMTPLCCHSTEQCASAECEHTKKTAQIYEKRRVCGVIGETAVGQEGKWSHC